MTGLHNRRVLPHNPYLLMKYQCHTDFEVGAGIAAIKYVYKRVFTGPDRTRAKLSALPVPEVAEEAGGSQALDDDEITEFQDARYFV